jgi:hypothetical protein
VTPSDLDALDREVAEALREAAESVVWRQECGGGDIRARAEEVERGSK